MKHLKQMRLAAAMALVLVGCVGVTSASATTLSPASTAFVLTSTNSSVTVHGASSINCTSSTVSGTTPLAPATTVSVPVTLAYSGCTAFGIAGATVTVPAVCNAAGASAVKLRITYNQASAPQANATVTIPSGCTITVNAPAITCTVTFSGDQTIGAAGGISWTNGTSTVKSFATLSSALVPLITVHTGGGFGCPTPGTRTGTANGTYRVTTPAVSPGITVAP
jgi:hypothetical protein